MTQTETVIVNDKDQLEDYYNKFKNEIFLGYNSRNYDQYIFKGILCGFDPFEISKHIIVDNLKGWQFSKLLIEFSINNYDVMNSFNSLKTLEAFMGHNIKETEVPFDIPRKLTKSEIEQTIKYCTHDVEELIEVFLRTKEEFDATMSLIKTFKLPLIDIGKSQAQLAAKILGAVKREYNDEFNIRIPDNRVMGKYEFIAKWFLDNKKDIENFYNNKLECNIAGVPHIVANGGLHGAIDKYFDTCKSDEIMIMADVDQLYPTLMVVYNLLSRSVKEPKKFEDILSTSLRLKAEKKKKERAPYKRICNITYGAEGDQTNAMYDPLHRTLVCIYGQIFVIDLIQKLETGVSSFKLIQSNTDGIFFKIKRSQFELVDDIVFQWEERTHLHMSFDFYKSVFQKDVNNYVVIDFEGKLKTKGAYVKQLNELDNDLPIVNKAMVDYMTKGVPIAQTINECKDLIMFQKVVKISGKYMHGLHNGTKLTDKTFRVFASKNPFDTAIYKVKNLEKNPEKFANTPEHCFINNDDINGVKVDSRLDKRWYINLTRERLEQFGVN